MTSIFHLAEQLGATHCMSALKDQQITPAYLRTGLLTPAMLWTFCGAPLGFSSRILAAASKKAQSTSAQDSTGVTSNAESSATQNTSSSRARGTGYRTRTDLTSGRTEIKK